MHIEHRIQGNHFPSSAQVPFRDAVFLSGYGCIQVLVSEQDPKGEEQNQLCTAVGGEKSEQGPVRAH